MAQNGFRARLQPLCRGVGQGPSTVRATSTWAWRSRPLVRLSLDNAPRTQCGWRLATCRRHLASWRRPRRHLQSGSREAPPPGSGRGLGGLARAAPVRWPRRCSGQLWRMEPARRCHPPQIITGAAQKQGGRLVEGQWQSQVRPERSSRSREEAELSETPKKWQWCRDRQLEGLLARGSLVSNYLLLLIIRMFCQRLGGELIYKVHRGGHVGSTVGAITTPGEWGSTYLGPNWSLGHTSHQC